MPSIAKSAASSPPGAVLRTIEEVSGFLRIVRILIEDGRRIDLTGIEGEIGRLCARALDLEPDQARTLTPLLSALLSEVDTIAARLAAFAPRTA
ncbi:MAG: hypothetical protein ACREFP_00135 [Acetobacteraceae bacterium]